jgi:hypothetical protein
VVFPFGRSYRSQHKEKLTNGTSITCCLLTSLCMRYELVSFNSLIYILDKVCRSSTRNRYSLTMTHISLWIMGSLLTAPRLSWLRFDSLKGIMATAAPIQRVQQYSMYAVKPKLFICIYTPVTISPFKCLPLPCLFYSIMVYLTMLSVSQAVLRRTVSRITGNNELERMWKEAVET